MILVRLLRSVWETTSNRFWPISGAAYIFLCELSKLSTEFPFITQAVPDGFMRLVTPGGVEGLIVFA